MRLENLNSEKFKAAELTKQMQAHIYGGGTQSQCEEQTNYSQGRDLYREIHDDENVCLFSVTYYYNLDCY